MGQRGDHTRERIAEAALAVLRERGVGGLSMRRVASTAGLALSNLQYHYPSRAALLAGVAEHHLQACHQAMERGLAGSTGDPLLATLRVSLGDPGVLAAGRVFRELFALAEVDQGVRMRLHAYFGQMFTQSVQALVDSGVQAPRERVEQVVAVLLTSIEGYYLIGQVTGIGAEDMARLLHSVALQMLA